MSGFRGLLALYDNGTVVGQGNGSSIGLATALAVGATIAVGAATAAGLTNPQGVGASEVHVVASSFGVGNAVAATGITFSAGGSAICTGVGASEARAVAVATGTSSASSGGSGAGGGEGSTSGTSSCIAIGVVDVSAVGNSAGVATVNAIVGQPVAIDLTGTSLTEIDLEGTNG